MFWKLYSKKIRPKEKHENFFLPTLFSPQDLFLYLAYEDESSLSQEGFSY